MAMPCTHCQHPNPPGAKFCNACAAKLEEACPHCGHANPPGSRFCNECGTPLTQQLSVASPQSSVASAQSLTSSSQDPAFGLRTSDPGRWTPPHLAARIRAEQRALEARGSTE